MQLISESDSTIGSVNETLRSSAHPLYSRNLEGKPQNVKLQSEVVVVKRSWRLRMALSNLLSPYIGAANRPKHQPPEFFAGTRDFVLAASARSSLALNFQREMAYLLSEVL